MPRVLVVDDNPLTLLFFEHALAAIGLACTTAGGGVDAIGLAAATRFDLLIIDACMPEIDGIGVLRGIRRGGGASNDARALASTAASACDHAPLLEAGFAGVVPKPITLADLRIVIGTHVHRTVSTEADLVQDWLDDARARATVGDDAGVVDALRGLLAIELDGLPDEFARLAAQRDLQGMADRLHRLAASAGLCGATALEREVAALRAAVTGQGSQGEAALARLLATCAETRRAINAAVARSGSTP